MEWRNSVFRRISADNPLHQRCHKFTLKPFIAISEGWAIQAYCKRLAGFHWEKRAYEQYKYEHQFCPFLFNFYARNCHLKSFISHSYVSSTWNCEQVPISTDSCFVLRETQICEKQSMMQCQGFDFIQRRVPWFLDFCKTTAVFMHDFDKNIGQNRPYTASRFFEIIFGQHRKHWLCPCTIKHLWRVK